MKDCSNEYVTCWNDRIDQIFARMVIVDTRTSIILEGLLLVATIFDYLVSLAQTSKLIIRLCSILQIHYIRL